MHPLSQLEAFHTRTKTWHIPLSPTTLHLDHQYPSSTHQENPNLDSIHTYTCQRGLMLGPSPRGQPAAASNTAGTALYLFGGWDGQQRYNDLWKLHIQGSSGQGSCTEPALLCQQWMWEAVEPCGSAEAVPCQRADHVMVGVVITFVTSRSCRFCRCCMQWQNGGGIRHNVVWSPRRIQQG